METIGSKILNIINNGEDNYIDTKQETIIFIIQNTPSRKDSINDKYSLNIQDNLIFGTEEDIISIKELLNNSTSLKNLGFNIKVGNVVWNQVKELLTNDEKNTRLIYSTDIENNKLTIKLIIPAIISELSDIKYPCNNHKILVVKISIKE